MTLRLIFDIICIINLMYNNDVFDDGGGAMKQIAQIRADDNPGEELITIYSVCNNGLYSILLSNGEDPGLPYYESLEELESSVEAAWGNWYTFNWTLM